MNRTACLVAIGLVSIVNAAPTWGGPPNPTASDGQSNTAGGSGAVLNVTSGASNTGFGALALFNTTSGQFNTALGASALLSNTT